MGEALDRLNQLSGYVGDGAEALAENLTFLAGKKDGDPRISRVPSSCLEAAAAVIREAITNAQSLDDEAEGGDDIDWAAAARAFFGSKGFQRRFARLDSAMPARQPEQVQERSSLPEGK